MTPPMWPGFGSEDGSNLSWANTCRLWTLDLYSGKVTGLVTHLLLLASRCCWQAHLSAAPQLQTGRRPLARQEPVALAAVAAEEAALLSPRLARKRGREEGRRVEAADPPPWARRRPPRMPASLSVSCAVETE